MQSNKIQRTATEIGYSAMLKQPGSFQTKAMDRVVRVASPKLTHAGMSFLKCAFASPDFANNRDMGVPDGKIGLSFMQSYKYISAITVPAGRQKIIIQPPIPGYAYSYLVNTSSVDDVSIFESVEYDGFNTLFVPDPIKGSKYADKVASFRMISQALELVPTTNQTKWSGSIRAFKVNLTSETRTLTNTSGNTVSFTNLLGMQGLNSTSCDQYVSPSNLGVFINAYNRTKEWKTHSIFEGVPKLPSQSDASAGTFGSITPPQPLSSRAIPGFANDFETSVVVINNTSGDTDQSFLIRCWQCVDYTPNPNESTLVGAAMESPPHDPVALQVYGELVRHLPVAVSYYENANFWDTVSSWIRKITTATSYIPGGVGMISKGINSLLI